MSNNHHCRVFKTPPRNTEAEADADALKLVEVLMAHAPELLPKDPERILMSLKPAPPVPESEIRKPPGAAALRKKAIA